MCSPLLPAPSAQELVPVLMISWDIWSRELTKGYYIRISLSVFTRKVSPPPRTCVPLYVYIYTLIKQMLAINFTECLF